MSYDLDDDFDALDASEEAALRKQREKRVLTALDSFTNARAEFTQWYVSVKKKEPQWANPIMNLLFHAWIAGSGKTEWLSQERIEAKAVSTAKRRVSAAAFKAEKAQREALEKERL